MKLLRELAGQREMFGGYVVKVFYPEDNETAYASDKYDSSERWQPQLEYDSKKAKVFYDREEAARVAKNINDTLDASLDIDDDDETEYHEVSIKRINRARK